MIAEVVLLGASCAPFLYSEARRRLRKRRARPLCPVGAAQASPAQAALCVTQPMAGKAPGKTLSWTGHRQPGPARGPLPAYGHGDLRGQVLSGQYLVERELGRGGMGIVYLASDLRLRTRVALKVLCSSVGADPMVARRRFVREAHAAQKVKHGNVIRTHRLHEDRGLLYLSMEYFEGQTLGDILGRKERFSIAEARRVLGQVADGLTAIHRAGIVHRDLKPENVMVNPLGLIKLIDFGLARAPFVRGVTAPSLLIGTPEYMAPEQVRGHSIDARTDLYALGCLAYHLLSGGPPFEAETPIALAFRHCIDIAVPLRERRGEVPEALAAAVHRALSKEPGDRFSSAEEMKRALCAGAAQADAAPAAQAAQAAQAA
jgi:serine/threonine-protein kinase